MPGKPIGERMAVVETGLNTVTNDIADIWDKKASVSSLEPLQRTVTWILRTLIGLLVMLAVSGTLGGVKYWQLSSKIDVLEERLSNTIANDKKAEELLNEIVKLLGE